MHIDSGVASAPASPERALTRRLISLADDTARGGLRRQAAMILELAFELFDEECWDSESVQ
jgi:hypothetical protein